MQTRVVLAIVIFAIVGCKKETAPPAPLASSVQSLPADLFTTTPPPGATDVAATRKSAKDGDAIVIKGQVAGAKEPIAANRAIMTVADLSLPTCDKTPGDKCPTPWDACCEPSDKIAANSLSVQVVGADGRPLKAGLGGATGIAPLKHVVVAGVVKMAAGSDTPIVEARQIYVQP
ncbi:MAG: hypothetical protein H7Z14_03775 [Anaerolineae bacterium]|nr:hypothetical protein [Phycisphaerae bacterium]